jgi:hypothetical protein
MDGRAARVADGQPVPVEFQAPGEHAIRIVVLGGNESDHRFIKPYRYRVRTQLCKEPMRIISANRCVEFRGIGGWPSSMSIRPSCPASPTLKGVLFGHATRTDLRSLYSSVISIGCRSLSQVEGPICRIVKAASGNRVTLRPKRSAEHDSKRGGFCHGCAIRSHHRIRA